MFKRLFMTLTIILMTKYAISTDDLCHYDIYEDYYHYEIKINPDAEDRHQSDFKIMDDNRVNIIGDVYYKICGYVDEKTYDDKTNEAKLVFIPTNKENQKIILDASNNWKIKNNNDNDNEEVTVIHGPTNNYFLKYKFKCDKSAKEPNTNISYVELTKTFEISVNSAEGCKVNTTPTYISIIACVFDVLFKVSFGIALGFFGFKLYNYHNMALFCGLAAGMVVSFGITKILIARDNVLLEELLLLFIFLIGYLFLITCFFQIVPIALIVFVSLFLALKTFNFFNEIMEINQKVTVTIFFILYLCPMLFCYLKLQDYYIIVFTSIIGSANLEDTLSIFAKLINKNNDFMLTYVISALSILLFIFCLSFQIMSKKSAKKDVDHEKDIEITFDDNKNG